MRGLLFLPVVGLCVSCGIAVDTGADPTACEPWVDGAAAAAVTPEATDPPGTVLLVRVGPFDEERLIHSVAFSTVPSVCLMPASLAVGAWASDTALPFEAPGDMLAPLAVETDGEGHGVVALPAEVVIPAGAFGWLARDLDGGCNAVAEAEMPGAETLLFRPDGSGFQAVDGQALFSPAECD